MRYSLLLLPLAALGLAACGAPEPARTVTTTYTPATTTTYITPAAPPYGAPAQTTTYVTPAPNPWAAPAQSTTTTYTNGPYSQPTQTTTTTRRTY